MEPTRGARRQLPQPHRIGRASALASRQGTLPTNTRLDLGGQQVEQSLHPRTPWLPCPSGCDPVKVQPGDPRAALFTSGWTGGITRVEVEAQVHAQVEWKSPQATSCSPSSLPSTHGILCRGPAWPAPPHISSLQWGVKKCQLHLSTYTAASPGGTEFS